MELVHKIENLVLNLFDALSKTEEARTENNKHKLSYQTQKIEELEQILKKELGL